MDGYNFVSQGRSDRSGGGVGIFVNESLKYKIREDLKLFVSEVESMFVELFFNRKSVIVVVVYRPPGQTILAFKESLEPILFKVIGDHKPCYIMGDFNINHFVGEEMEPNDFVQFMNSYSFSPVISKPTRITIETSTLLDNIFVNSTCDDYLSGIITYPVSDHMPHILYF